MLWAVGTSSKPTSQHLFGGMDGSCLLCPIITVSFFSFFLGTHCRHQVQTRGHSPGHQVKDTRIRVTLRVWHLRQFHWGRDLVVWARSIIPRRK